MAQGGVDMSHCAGGNELGVSEAYLGVNLRVEKTLIDIGWNADFWRDSAKLWEELERLIPSRKLGGGQKVAYDLHCRVVSRLEFGGDFEVLIPVEIPSGPMAFFRTQEHPNKRELPLKWKLREF